ncbi:hypothetical protein KFE25_007422 [Diacronema lutheri]|uniref:TOG domain-containing protein n=1 Tax=Diacronema lutheri TaxID=2081491 RepID=A0A8J5XZU5_DIALT|nr:hypothetical protein KFE25_007422 [Diacronema lutheri]
MGSPLPGTRLLRFVVASCSSEDDEHPARELHNTTAQSRGWQCAHFAPFPQELLLRFEGLVHLSQLQVLCHQYKIPSRVELFTSTEPSTLASAAGASFKRLGHFSLDPNARSRFRSRELKTVYVQAAPATMLRISMHKCHLNELNVYAQVGILAIRVHGTGAGEYVPRAAAAAYAPPPADAHGSDGGGARAYAPAPVSAKPFQLARAPRPVDAVTQRQLASLEEAKARAIAREDYDEAKRLKESIHELQAAGEQICALEMQKRAAVQREDYDEAKQLKEQVDSLRANAALLSGLDDGGAAGGGGGGGGGGSSRARSRSGSALGEQRAGTPRAPPSRGGSEAEAYAFGEEPLSDQHGGGGQRDGAGAADGRHGDGAPSSAGSATRSALDSAPMPGALADADAPSPRATARHAPSHNGIAERTQAAYDERALPAPSASYDEMRGGGGEVDGTSARAQPAGDGATAANAGGSIGGQLGDLPAPEVLSTVDEAEAALMIEVLGEFTVQCAYSKVWMLRQAALHRLREAIPVLPDSHAPINCVRAAVQLLRRCAADKIAQVFLASLELTPDVQQLGAGLRPAEFAQLVEPLVGPWLGKTADSNARVREASEGALLALCRASPQTIEMVGTLASAPLRKAGDVRGLLGRLSLLAYLVAEFGSAAPLERCLAFAKAGLSSPNAQVRARAIDVCREAYRISNAGSLGWLLNDLKPAQRETVASMLNEVDAERSVHGDPSPIDQDVLSDIAEGNEEDAPGGSGKGAPSTTHAGRLAPPQQPAGAHGGRGSRALSSTSELKGSFVVPAHAGAGAADGGGGEADGGDAIDEHTCQFCSRHDPTFSDENLDLHFWRDCPMLMTCSMCEQVVEISFFREHLLTECENGESPAHGERLSEGTCPLCGVVVPADDDGWTNHLLVDTCQRNPRPVLAASPTRQRQAAKRA